MGVQQRSSNSISVQFYNIPPGLHLVMTHVHHVVFRHVVIRSFARAGSCLCFGRGRGYGPQARPCRLKGLLLTKNLPGIVANQ